MSTMRVTIIARVGVCYLFLLSFDDRREGTICLTKGRGGEGTDLCLLCLSESSCVMHTRDSSFASSGMSERVDERSVLTSVCLRTIWELRESTVWGTRGWGLGEVEEVCLLFWLLLLLLLLCLSLVLSDTLHDRGEKEDFLSKIEKVLYTLRLTRLVACNSSSQLWTESLLEGVLLLIFVSLVAEDFLTLEGENNILWVYDIPDLTKWSASNKERTTCH